jgi:ribA/ribD-fused uncharacterized protein
MNELKRLIDNDWSISTRLSGSKYMILAVHNVTGQEINSSHRTLTGAIDILYERCTTGDTKAVKYCFCYYCRATLEDSEAKKIGSNNSKYHACQVCFKEMGLLLIDNFKNEFAFLSNFSPSPILSVDGKRWATVEHFYQGAKTLDEKEREAIRLAPSPGKAKRMGQRVSLRSDWEDVKQKIMLEGIRLKFGCGSDLAQKLLKTGNHDLVEGNCWHDNIWGDCYCLDCGNIKGQNLLGKLLMQVRMELMELE